MNENYEDYEENLDNTEYEEEKDNSSRNKKIILAILVIIGIIIIILLLRACGKGNEKFNPEKTLLEAGKEYYDYNSNEVPKAKSSCTEVALDTLINEGLIERKKYSDCDGKDTYVKVCLLENGKKHFVPILSCDSFDSDKLYESFKDGDLKDIIADETDIEFTYLGRVLKTDNGALGDTTEIWYGEKSPYEKYKTLSKITYYRYRELQYKWYQVTNLYYPNNTVTPGKELYIVAPNNSYTNKDNTQMASKWYKSEGTGEKIYYDGFSYTAPDGYPIADTTQGYKVSSKSRTFTKIDNPATFPAVKMYQCAESKYKDQIEAGNLQGIVFSNEIYACGNKDNKYPTHDYEYRTFYSCDSGKTENSSSAVCYTCQSGELNSDKTACGTYGKWSYSGSSCNGSSDICENFTNPINLYKWYKYSSEKRSYYPSGSSTSAGESTYYAEIPAEGYIKDTATSTTAWSWYQTASSITAEYLTVAPSTNSTRSDQSKWTDWTQWSTNAVSGLGNAGTRSIETKVKLKVQEIKNVTDKDYEDLGKEYVTEEELIKVFKAKGFEVETLEDIAMNGELSYLAKMKIRNKK